MTVSISFPDVLGAQNIMGTTGLVTIPTARMQNDGTLSAGISYIDRKHQEYFEGTKDIANAWINFTFLPFLELAVRLNRPLNYPYKTYTYSFDRTPMFRLRALKERKYIPAIVLGIHDMASTSNSGTVYFNATYIVLSKRLNDFDIHLGYAPPIMKARYYQLNGLFGGVSYIPHKNISLLAEYDTKTVNAGVHFEFFKHFGINLSTIKFDSFAAGMNCKVVL